MNERNFSKNQILLLTLKKHRFGVWIEQLLNQFSLHHKDIFDAIKIVEVDDLSLNDLTVSNTPPKWKLVINRVSDAAGLRAMKVTSAILTCAELWNIPTINGKPFTYNLGCSKALHHHVIERADCKVPKSVFIALDRPTEKNIPKITLIDSVKTLHNVIQNAAESSEIIVIKAGANWCPPCVDVAQEYQLLAAEFMITGNRRVRFCKIDLTDKNDNDSAAAFHAIGGKKMPYFAFIKARVQYGSVKGPYIDFVRRGIAKSLSDEEEEEMKGKLMKRSKSKTYNSLRTAAQQLLDAGCSFPLLIKPNAAGFGNGIKSIANFDELEKYAKFVDAGVINASVDDLVLLQEYIVPDDQSVYRVWFLDGKCQCAVKVFRQTNQNSNVNGKGKEENNDATSTIVSKSNFTGGCVGGCSNTKHSSKTPAFSAWEIPAKVQFNVEKIAALCKADLGSVEFMYKDGVPLYFDVNMLSTIPTNGDPSVMDERKLWKSRDFWREQANFIVKEFQKIEK
eukprot:g4784.t1